MSSPHTLKSGAHLKAEASALRGSHIPRPAPVQPVDEMASVVDEMASVLSST